MVAWLTHPGLCYAQPPSLWQAIERVFYFLPLFAQRRVGRAAQRCRGILNGMCVSITIYGIYFPFYLLFIT